jgi:arylamine N-acetyltransferase
MSLIKSYGDAIRFVSGLGLSDPLISSDWIRELLVVFFREIPFTNLMMLVRLRRPPTNENIIEDLTSHLGGPCGHINPFLCDLLIHCGFNASLTPAWMKGKLSHMAILVSIDGDELWIDAGNGHPYIEPITLKASGSFNHAGLIYRIRSEQDYYIVEQKYQKIENFRENYRFMNLKVDFKFFNSMVKQHYTDSNFGPFLSGIRLIRYDSGIMYAIRDREFITHSNSERTIQELTSKSDYKEIIDKYFNGRNYPIEKALERLGW